MFENKSWYKNNTLSYKKIFFLEFLIMEITSKVISVRLP